MSDDLVSRQAAINIIRQKIGYIDDGRSFETELGDVLMSACKNFIKDIEKLPSVQPKVGRWKSCYDYYRCSECGEEDYVPRDFCNGFRWEYCPYCGVKMKS